MRNLDENELAERWHKSPRTLQGWRQQGKGPRYLKIGTRVLYPLAEIEVYEAASLHANTNGPLVDDSKSGRAAVDADVVAGSLGDQKVAGGRNAHRSSPSPTKTSHRRVRSPPGAARAGKRAADDREHRASAHGHRHCRRLTSIAATTFLDEGS